DRIDKHRNAATGADDGVFVSAHAHEGGESDEGEVASRSALRHVGGSGVGELRQRDAVRANATVDGHRHRTRPTSRLHVGDPGAGLVGIAIDFDAVKTGLHPLAQEDLRQAISPGPNRGSLDQRLAIEGQTKAKVVEDIHVFQARDGLVSVENAVVVFKKTAATDFALDGAVARKTLVEILTAGDGLEHETGTVSVQVEAVVA